MMSSGDSSSIPPNPPPSSPGASGKHAAKGYKAHHEATSGKGPHAGAEGGDKFLGMNLTHKQKKELYSNLSKQVIASIKDDQDRQVKALKNIRNAAEGNPLEP